LAQLNHKKRIIVSVTNDLVTDNRVHKVCTTLSEMGFELTLVGRKLKNSLPLQRAYHTHRMRLLFTKGPFFYAEYNIRLFIYLLSHRANVLLANDLDTLLANYLAARLCRRKLVYDSHEYFTGVPEIANRPLVKATWEQIEKWIFPKLEVVYTVNESIAGLYEKQYGKKLEIIRNVSNRLVKTTGKTRKDLGLPEDKNIAILQGAGINIDRGAEEALQAMQYVDQAIFIIVGSGDVIEILKSMVAELNLEEKVLFRGKLPFDEMMQYTQVADLGLTLDKDTNINYRYSLPNKVFDYIQAGIPVLASNLVEVANVVKSYGVGDVVESHDPKAIAAKMTEMFVKSKSGVWKENIRKAAEELCWEKESIKLKEIYSKL
jgi:glycosyltransferase involved in cell wall biosynthesis